MVYLVEVQSLSHVQLLATPWTAACQASLSFTISRSLLKLLSLSDVYVRNFPYLFYTLINLYYPKHSERSSLITGPGLNSSPPEAMNPGIVHSLFSQFSSVWLFATSWTAAHQASLHIANTRSLLKFMSVESVMPPNHLILCGPLLLLTSIFTSSRVFSDESVLPIRWPKYWSFNFSISPSNEYSRLISFRIDWLDLLAVQGTLKSLPQHHSSKASILQCSAFFMVQLSHPYMTTGKTIALTRQTYVGEVMSLLFNMLSRLVITFLPRNKHLLISWLQLPLAVILKPPNRKRNTSKLYIVTLLI